MRFAVSNIVDKVFRLAKKIIPKRIFNFFQPYYHQLLSRAGAFMYGHPSEKLKVIGITGTKGKSTVAYLATNFLKKAGKKVGMVGSLGIEINGRYWPNNLKMTMPGRFKLHKLLKEMVDAGCEYAILEVTSEGIKQYRHKGIKFDCAIFTNLSQEHIEAHGSFEKYYEAKQELFKATDHIHVLNADSPYLSLFMFPAKKKFFYSLRDGFEYSTHLTGDFNKSNILAAAKILEAYGIEDKYVQESLNEIKFVPGRMEFVQKEPFQVVVDYAHTPDSLEMVYKVFKKEPGQTGESKLICVLGAAGGGRDTWKRPVFGEIASKYCDEIFLTNEDPYEEDPEEILNQVQKGIKDSKYKISNVHRIIDRKEAVKEALTKANKNDIVVITGKGSETTMAVAAGKKIPWSDRKIVQELLNKEE